MADPVRDKLYGEKRGNVEVIGVDERPRLGYGDPGPIETQEFGVSATTALICCGVAVAVVLGTLVYAWWWL